MTTSACDIIDMSRYPLTNLSSANGRALLQTAQDELAEHGCAVLPHFLRPEALTAGVAECERGIE